MNIISPSTAAEKQATISPVDGSVYVELALASQAEVVSALATARAVQADWRRTSLAERGARLGAMVEAMVAKTDAIAAEITWQMGRPIATRRVSCAALPSAHGP